MTEYVGSSKLAVNIAQKGILPRILCGVWQRVDDTDEVHCGFGKNAVRNRVLFAGAALGLTALISGLANASERHAQDTMQCNQITASQTPEEMLALPTDSAGRQVFQTERDDGSMNTCASYFVLD